VGRLANAPCGASSRKSATEEGKKKGEKKMIQINLMNPKWGTALRRAELRGDIRHGDNRFYAVRYVMCLAETDPIKSLICWSADFRRKHKHTI
jgi:hypothetical protein